MNTLDLASGPRDGWQLLSGERQHALTPQTFWLPDAEDRTSLQRGMQVKLMFEIATPHSPDGPQTERMWVAVLSRHGDRYLGMLRNQPFCLDADDEATYLRWGAEIPFGPEHIIDILNEQVVSEGELAQVTRTWPHQPPFTRETSPIG